MNSADPLDGPEQADAIRIDTNRSLALDAIVKEVGQPHQAMHNERSP